MQAKITKEMPIGELVMNYPEAVEVLFSHGFHCIGCGLSAYETLEQGALTHGFDQKMIDEIVEQIKDAVKGNKKK
jgi:hydroxylamine reductase